MLRLKGLAKTSDGRNRDRLTEVLGYRLVRDGDDWIVPEDDPKLIAGPPDIIKVGKNLLTLKEDQYEKNAEIYAENYLNTTLEKEIRSRREHLEVTIPRDFGIKSAIYEKRLKLFLDRGDGIKGLLCTEIFPYMQKELNAKYICPLQVDAVYQQGIISINKILLLIDKFGLEDGQRLILERRSLESILPTPLNVFSYIEALLTFSPLIISIPFNRIGSQIHFLAERPWFFHHIATENIFEFFLSDQEPMATGGEHFVADKLSLTAHSNKIYFFKCIGAINNLTRFFNDMRVFTEPDGSIDHDKFIKTQSCLHLIFSDLVSINYTNSKYLKLRQSLSFLDKLSSLKCNFLNSIEKQAEENFFKQYLNISTGVTVGKMLNYHFSQEYTQLGKALKSLSSAIWTGLHENVKLSAGKPEGDSDFVVDILRTVRNTNHGTFLRYGKFEDTFFLGSIHIPSHIHYIPLLLTWCLALDPKYFFENI